MTGIQVVKIGGAALMDVNWLQRFAVRARSSVPRVVVHGGGPEVSALSTRLGIDVRWHNGRRITSPEALDVAAMVLTGRINKRIVRALNSAGVDALGLSGEDGRLITARMAQGGVLGEVGEVESVRTQLLSALLELGLVPVISPLSCTVDGHALNVNADEVAAAVARALDARELLFLTDVAAVRDESGECRELAQDRARALIEANVATGGMAVKLSAALSALEAGVTCVRIGSLAMLDEPGAGTLIRQEGVLT
jgi:acetylglutamate kinase